ncbi:MAG: transposase [Bacteroidota bacterium]|nr:transposase [Bacteroidota bacterium]
MQLYESIRTPKGPRHKLIVSLGTKFLIPKIDRKEVARIVKERLSGQMSLLVNDMHLIRYADYVVKKIQTEGKWDSARQRVCKFKESDQRTAEIFIDDVIHGYDRELGPLLIGVNILKQLKFSEMLRECGFKESEVKTAQISVLNRLIAQDSEYGIIPWMQTIAVDEIFGIDSMQFGHDRFYRISDKLLKNQSHIEESLYQREKNLFSLDDCIFLYDLTNTYFEGVCANNPKAQYSKNQKEKRSDCPQVVVALMLDGDGFIRHHRVFDGKMSDTRSLSIILAGLKSDFSNKPMPTIIFDRGMVSKKNMELLQSYKNLKYIVMCRNNEENQFIEDFQTKKFEVISGRCSSKKVEVLTKSIDNIVYLLCKSQGRKEKEQAMRNRKEERMEAELEKLHHQIKNGRANKSSKIEQKIGKIKERFGTVAQYYEIKYTTWQFSYFVLKHGTICKRLNTSLLKLKEKADNKTITFPAITKKLLILQEKYPLDYKKLEICLIPPALNYGPRDEIREKKEAMDGNYLLKTNRSDLHADEIWQLYVMLTRIENAFKDLKSHLGLRPNRHHKENRVDGHIFISIIAYHLLHTIEYKLRSQGDHTKWATIKRIVSTHSYSTIQLPTTNGTVINIRKPGIPEGIHKEIYTKLEIDCQHLPVKRNCA